MQTFLYALLGLVVFLLVLGVLVIIHEGGHFFVAKKSGILCHEYAVGMGPVIAQKKFGETMYSIRAIPIGGYVAMAGEDETDLLQGVEEVRLIIDDKEDTDGVVTKIIINLKNPKYENIPIYKVLSYDITGTKDALDDELFIEVEDSEGMSKRFTIKRDAMVNHQKKEEIQIAPFNRQFMNKPLINRFLTVLAGPFMNFVLALVIFFVMGLIWGYADTSTNKVDKVSDAALTAGLADGDYITKIADVNISTWNDISTTMASVAKGEYLNADGSILVEYKRGDETASVLVYPNFYIMSSQLILATSSINYSDYTSALKVTLSDPKDLDSLKNTGLELGCYIIKADVFDKKDNLIGSARADDIKAFLGLFTDVIGESEGYVVYQYLKEENGALVEYQTKEAINLYTKGMLDASGYPQTKALLGVSTGSTKKIGKLFGMPWVRFGESATQIFKTLRLLFKRHSGVKITDLSGPVGIFNLFRQIVQGDDVFYQILYWSALLSVNLGIINLLPLPALDGGRIAFIIYEAITKRRPTPKIENLIHNIGFIILIVFFVFIAISDIIKCF